MVKKLIFLKKYDAFRKIAIGGAVLWLRLHTGGFLSLKTLSKIRVRTWVSQPASKQSKRTISG